MGACRHVVWRQGTYRRMVWRQGPPPSGTRPLPPNGSAGGGYRQTNYWGDAPSLTQPTQPTEPPVGSTPPH
uniref:Uncharacterized protein n=1 Tax=Leersia perrieri TaxID=77586 RepID=A0A0D9WYL1_9ORYZ